MQMNLDDLEKQWEDGNDLDELKTGQQAKFERLEKRRKAAEASAGTFDPRQACLFDQKRAHEIRQVCLKVVASMRLGSRPRAIRVAKRWRSHQGRDHNGSDTFRTTLDAATIDQETIRRRAFPLKD